MANIKRALLCLAFLAFALPAAAQVALPRTGVLNNAQPVFCVNPTTGAVEDCVSGGGGGGGAITAASGSYSSGALSAGAIVDLGTGASPAANTVNANLNTGNTSAATTATNTGTTATNTGTIATNTGTTATNTGTIAGAVSSSVMQSNTKQVNGVTTLTGAGATGTGSQRVTAAQDTTTIAGSAPGTAGTPSTEVLTIQGISGMTAVGVNVANATGNIMPTNVTPTDCSGTITTGGTAQNAFTAQTTLHGFSIANIDTSAGSGEPLWFSFTTTAAASTAASYPLAAPTATTFASLSSFTTPAGFGTNHAVSVIGATTGHKFSCTWW